MSLAAHGGPAAHATSIPRWPGAGSLVRFMFTPGRSCGSRHLFFGLCACGELAAARRQDCQPWRGISSTVSMRRSPHRITAQSWARLNANAFVSFRCLRIKYHFNTQFRLHLMPGRMGCAGSWDGAGKAAPPAGTGGPPDALGGAVQAGVQEGRKGAAVRLMAHRPAARAGGPALAAMRRAGPRFRPVEGSRAI